MSRATYNSRNSQQFELPLAVRADLPAWRPIHYLGSKLRLVGSIRKLVSELDPKAGTVCDLFAGSGTVSLALSNERNVVAADIQEYSRVICTALLRPASMDDSAVSHMFARIDRNRKDLERCLEPVLELEQLAIDSATTSPSLLCDLVERGSLVSGSKGCDALAAVLRETTARIEKSPLGLTATRYFGGVYFSYAQTLYIDSALNAVAELPSTFKEVCLAAILSMASSIVNSVGKQFAQPMRPRRSDGTIKRHLVSQMCRDRGLDASKTFCAWLSKYRELRCAGSHRVICSDYRQVLPQLGDVSVVYADPPYTRDHYSRFYHVLETLCLRDNPLVSTTLLTGQGATSRGLYRADRHQSPFCIKSQAPMAFAELFAGSRKLGVPVLVSYSPFVKNGHPRLMTVEAVSKIAAEYYRNVEVLPAEPIAHSKLNKTELHLDASYKAEVFIVCRP